MIQTHICDAAHLKGDHGRGDTHIDMIYMYYMCLPFGGLFVDFDTVIRGFLSQMKTPNLHKLSVFRANDGKKAPNLSKIGWFLYKIGILMGGKWGQN